MHFFPKFLTLFYGISYCFSETLTEVAVRRKILQMIVLKYEEKIMENDRGGDYFYNDECARPPTH